MAINKFNAKNGLSVGVPAIDVIDSNANATFNTLSVTGISDLTNIVTNTISASVYYNLPNISTYTKLTTATSATVDSKYMVSTSASGFNIFLPQGIEGNTIEFWDYDGTWVTKAPTLVPYGTQRIDSITETLVLDVSNIRLVLTYTSPSRGWQIDIGGNSSYGYNTTGSSFASLAYSASMGVAL